MSESAGRPVDSEFEHEAPDTPGTWQERCSVLYQVVGVLANQLGIFETSHDVADALDVAAGRGDVANLLPWPKKGLAPSPAGPDALAEVERILATIPNAPTNPKWREKDMAYLPSEMRTLRDYITALRSRPAQGDIRHCGHTFDGKAIRPCPICDAAMSQQEKRDG